MQGRSTVRYSSAQPLPRQVIEDCFLAAGSAPSGASLQPWRFVVVSDPAIKRQIREASEREEYLFCHERAPEDWLEALAPLATDEHEPCLEIALSLVGIFALNYRVLPNGRKVKNYYVGESVGIATAILITAVPRAGLVSLTQEQRL